MLVHTSFLASWRYTIFGPISQSRFGPECTSGTVQPPDQNPSRLLSFTPQEKVVLLYRTQCSLSQKKNAVISLALSLSLSLSHTLCGRFFIDWGCVICIRKFPSSFFLFVFRSHERTPREIILVENFCLGPQSSSAHSYPRFS